MNRHFWFFGGPVSLFIALALLMLRTSHLLGRPVWLFGLSISILIALGVTYLTFKEILARESLLKALKTEKENQAASIRATFEEAHGLFQNKMEKLEEILSGMEKENQQLQLGYEQVHQTSQKEKAKASAFQTSLEDALEALREANQLHFLKEQHIASVSPGLSSRHKQLREQFDEKALVLDQTRRRLFTLEGELFALRRERADEKIDESKELDQMQADLSQLFGENQRLEREIENLETLVAEILKPKEKKKSPATKKVEKMLELQLDL